MKYVFLVTEQISNNENWFLTDFFFFDEQNFFFIK